MTEPRERRKPSTEMAAAISAAETVIIRRKPFEKNVKTDPYSAIHLAPPKRRPKLAPKDRVPTKKSQVILGIGGEPNRITYLRKVRIGSANDGSFTNYGPRTKTGSLIETGHVPDMPRIAGVLQSAHGASRPNSSYGAYRNGRDGDGNPLGPKEGGRFYNRTLFYTEDDGEEIEVANVQIVRAGPADSIRRRVKVKKPA